MWRRSGACGFPRFGFSSLAASGTAVGHRLRQRPVIVRRCAADAGRCFCCCGLGSLVVAAALLEYERNAAGDLEVGEPRLLDFDWAAVLAGVLDFVLVHA